MKQTVKIVAVIISVILAGLIVFLLVREKQTEKEIQRKAVELEKDLRPIEVERNKLRQELDSLRDEKVKNIQGTGSAVLLFIDLSETIYTEIFPQMREAGFTGVLAVSEKQFPGQKGCLSQEQFRELTAAGWKCCVRWEDGMETGEWLASFRMTAQETGIDEPKAAYFPMNTYKSEWEKILVKEGFFIAVQYDEEYKPLTVSEAGEGLWYPDVISWRDEDVLQALEEAVSKRKNIVFTIGADSEKEQYEKEDFARALKQLQEYCGKERLKVMDLDSAREYHKGIEEENAKLREEYEGRDMELTEQIEGLEEEIDRITEEYLKK